MPKPWYEKDHSPHIRAARDAQEEAAIAGALDELPIGHPAREAFAAGVDTIALTHLVADQAATLEVLKQAYLDGFARRIGAYFRP